MRIFSKLFGKKSQTNVQESETTSLEIGQQAKPVGVRHSSKKKMSKKQRKLEKRKMRLKQKQEAKQAANAPVKVKVYHLIVLDESGSMTCVTRQTISGCNETIQTIRTMQEANMDTQQHIVSIYLFDSSNSRYIVKNQTISEVKEITEKDYSPNACTPLFDALGFTLTDMKELMQQENVLGYVTIITDGEENDSHKYTIADVRHLIDELKKLNVIFSFIGANIDAAEYAENLHINNSMQFMQDDEGMRQMWQQERRGKIRSSAKMRNMIINHAFDPYAFSQLEGRGAYYDMDVDENRLSSDMITTLGDNEIFVFGSNPEGLHNGGASALALAKFGAKSGQAEGLQGQSYAIPTDGVNVMQLSEAVSRFCDFASQHPELTFLVTAIGCGTAGWRPHDVAPMFQRVAKLKNVKLPRVFCDYLDFTLQ